MLCPAMPCYALPCLPCPALPCAKSCHGTQVRVLCSNNDDMVRAFDSETFQLVRCACLFQSGTHAGRGVSCCWAGVLLRHLPCMLVVMRPNPAGLAHGMPAAQHAQPCFSSTPTLCRPAPGPTLPPRRSQLPLPWAVNCTVMQPGSCRLLLTVGDDPTAHVYEASSGRQVGRCFLAWFPGPRLPAWVASGDCGLPEAFSVLGPMLTRRPISAPLGPLLPEFLSC